MTGIRSRAGPQTGKRLRNLFSVPHSLFLRKFRYLSGSKSYQTNSYDDFETCRKRVTLLPEITSLDKGQSCPDTPIINAVLNTFTLRSVPTYKSSCHTPCHSCFIASLKFSKPYFSATELRAVLESF